MPWLQATVWLDDAVVFNSTADASENATYVG